MKIIGEANGEWICTLTTGEIANLQGLDSTYRDNFRKPQVGMSLDISKQWQKFYKVNLLLDHKETLKGYCQKMLEAADGLQIDYLRFDGEEK